MSRIASLAMVLLLASLAGAQEVREGPAPDGPLEYELAMLERLDDIRIAVDWRGTQLDEALGDLERQGVPVRADWGALRSIGVRGTEKVTLTVDVTSAARVIDGMLAQLGDEYDRPVLEARGTVFLMTTVAAAGTLRRTDAYDVRDVLSAHGTDGAAPGEAARRVLRLLVDHVDPEAWVEFGGSRNRIDVVDGALVVTASPSVHLRLRRALARLRAAVPTGVKVRVSVRELPAATVAALLAQSSGPTDDSLRRSILRHAEAVELRRASTITAVGGRSERSGRCGEHRIALVVEPKQDTTGGGVRVDVSVELDLAGDSDEFSTTLAVPDHLSGAVLELTTAPNAEVARVLVVEVERY